MLWAFLNGKALFIADEIMQIKLRSLTIGMVGERGVLYYSKLNTLLAEKERLINVLLDRK